jgi:hypothetical protein
MKLLPRIEKTKYQLVNFKRRHTCRRPKYRWVDSIKMGTTKTGIRSVDWMKLIRDKVQWHDSVNTVMNLTAVDQRKNYHLLKLTWS